MRYIVFVAKPDGNRPIGKPRRTWVNNIMMDPEERRLKSVDWIGLAQDRRKWRALVNAVTTLRVA
jgi:hypothetical protein